MLQEQSALTAKALGWKASFQRGFGAQYCRTDRHCSLNAHSDILVWKFWNSPMHKAVCPSHCFFHQLHSPLSAEQTSAGNPNWESHLYIRKEAKDCVFSYTLRAIHSEKTTLMTFTCNNLESQTFSFSSYTFACQCHCQMTKLSGSGGSHLSHFPSHFTFTVIICHARGSSESQQLLESTDYQSIQRKHDTFQVHVVCPRAGRGDLQGAHFRVLSCWLQKARLISRNNFVVSKWQTYAAKAALESLKGVKE